MPPRIIVIGGVAGGMSAATRLRRLMEDAEIVVFERSGHVSFANCGLPYYAGGVIRDRGELLLQTPASLGARFRLDVRVDHEVLSIDRAAKTVEVRDAATGATTTEAYDALVLSPGAEPVRPPIPGIERALSLRDVEDVDAMVAALDAAARRAGDDRAAAVVIGGGFIGLELAENLVGRGLRVAVVEATDQVMAPLDPEMAGPVHQLLRDHGVDLRLGSAVAAIGEDSVTLADGSILPAAIVVAAIGVRAASGLAKDAGLEVGDRGGIVVDAGLRTSDPSIYAVGDAVQKRDALDGSAAMVPLANTANLQGRLVADAIAGRKVGVRGVAGTAIVGLFGTAIATTGWNEKRLRGAGRDCLAIHTHPANHAGYYPGAEDMSLKLLVDPATDEILGAQAIGGAGVDKRIDVIATAMAGGITASGLAELELAYSPQFGSAKDPVNMLGYIARNHREGLVRTVQWHELEEVLASGAVLVDVRTPEEHAADAIEGSLNIPLDELRGRLDELPEAEVVLHCAAGLRGYLAARILDQHGIPALNLDGGFRTWSAAADARRGAAAAR